jgi:diacylglycerol kinase (ATP)
VVDAAEHEAGQSSVGGVRIELIANEESGGGTDVAALEEALRREGAEIVQERAERVVISGGDGSVGGAAARAAELGVALAVIPAGTANDFARALDLPREHDAAIRLAVTGAELRRLELGDIDGTPFVNVASLGLGPSAARRAAPLKRLLGPLAYSVGALAAGALDRPAEVAVEGIFEGRAWQLTVACTGAFGGGSEIEEADPHDGRLDLVVVPDGPRIGLARRAAGMRNGTIAAQPGVLHARRDDLVLRVPAGTAFNVDGEVVRTGPLVRVTVRDAVDVVVG